MAGSEKVGRLAGLVAVITAVAGISGIFWAYWDHVHPKPSALPAAISASPTASSSVRGSHNNTVQTVTSGNGNIVNNSGNVTITSGRTIPVSEREAARQRLHDSGIEYSADRYDDALRNHEADVVDLFTKAGMMLNSNTMRSFVVLSYDPDVAAALSQADQSGGCPTDVYDAANFYSDLKGPPLQFVQRICSTDSVRTKLRATLQQEEQRLKQIQQQDRENQGNTAREIASCEQTIIRTFGSRVSAASAHEDCQMRVIPPTPQQGRVQERIPLLEKALSIVGGAN